MSLMILLRIPFDGKSNKRVGDEKNELICRMNPDWEELVPKRILRLTAFAQDDRYEAY